jgi:hypothetical protein
MSPVEAKRQWCGQARQLLGLASMAGQVAEPGEVDATLAQWAAARSSVIATLSAISREIKDAHLEESDKAVMEIRAVMAQLSADPDTAQRVLELRSYLETDDVVAEVSELAEDIRSPLLRALSTVAARLGAMTS